MLISNMPSLIPENVMSCHIAPPCSFQFKDMDPQDGYASLIIAKCKSLFYLITHHHLIHLSIYDVGAYNDRTVDRRWYERV